MKKERFIFIFLDKTVKMQYNKMKKK